MKNNTSSTTEFRQIPFNMTIAKRISDGSVVGRVSIFNQNGVNLGRALFTHNNPYGDVFTIMPNAETDTEHYTSYLVCFNSEGKSIGEHDRDKWYLVIEIPSETIYKDEHCNANSGVKEKQELEKDKHYHKCKIEPIEYILANNLGFCEGNVVKYITRYKDKGGVDDLRKIKIYVDYIIDDLTKTDDTDN